MVNVGKEMNRHTYFVIIFFIVIVVGAGLYQVNAATTYNVVNGKVITFSSTTGNYNGTGNGTTRKKLNGVDAYCTQLGKSITNKTYSIDDSFDYSSVNALIAGKCIELVKDKYDNDDAQYLYATELLNYVFKYSGYVNYVDKNSELKEIYNEAYSFVKNTAKYSGNAASKLPSITLKSATNNNMNSMPTTGIYISNQITLSGLVSNYGSGNNTNTGDTTYKISVSSSSGTAYICTDAAGKSCVASSKTLSKPSGNNTFYVKVVGASAGGDVKISVSGSNKSTYPSVNKYISNSASQILMVAGVATFSRSISTSLNLSIPDSTKHSIKVYKVDEFGNSLEGASLFLYRVGKSVKVDTISDLSGYTAIAFNKNGGASLSYSVTNADDNDDYFQWKYCVAESGSPNGYILPASFSAICYEPTNSTVTTCLDSSGTKTDDLNYCGAYYSCSEGELSGNKCIVSKTSDPTPYCNEGFELNNGSCVKVEGPTDPVPTCAEGYTLNAVDTSVCINNEDSNVTVPSTLSCTTGELSNEDSKCYTTTVTTPNYNCSEGTYNNDTGKCVSSSTNDASCLNGDNKVDSKYCETSDQYTKVVQNGGDLTFTKINIPSSVTISKTDITGDNEVPGAILKICSNKPDDAGNCNVVTISQKGLSCPSSTSELGDEFTSTTSCSYDSDSDTRTISLRWTSTDVPRTWTGLEVGKTYYLVEESAPTGYIAVSTTTEFTIDSDGTVKEGGTSVSDNTIVINNELTDLTISKQDVATSEELPGATLSICESHIDEDGNLAMSVDDFGNCTVVTLADGSAATWVSEDTPHSVSGLGAGTYYLVEIVAPEGYDTAESVVFTMNRDGTLTDANGESLDNNKLIMYDKQIVTVTTGDLPIILISVLAIAGIGFAIYYSKNKDFVNKKFGDFINRFKTKKA